MNSFVRDFGRFGIGFDSIFDQIDRLSKQTGFPFWNLYKEKDGYQLKIALAGYGKDDVEVSLDGDKLTISSEGVKQEKDVKIVTQGFTQRPFSLQFTLSPHSVIEEVDMENGILCIGIKYEQNSKTKKVFEIGYKGSPQLLTE